MLTRMYKWIKTKDISWYKIKKTLLSENSRRKLSNKIISIPISFQNMVRNREREWESCKI